MGTQRWTSTFPKNGLNLVSRIQLIGMDVHREDPAGAWYQGEHTPEELQEYLREQVRPGDSIQLCYGAEDGLSEQTRYRVRHNHHHVGVSSELFLRDLYEVLHYTKNWKVYFPFLISDAFIEGIDTVVGPSQNSVGGPNPFWLRPRVYGLAKLHHATKRG